MWTGLIMGFFLGAFGLAYTVHGVRGMLRRHIVGETSSGPVTHTGRGAVKVGALVALFGIYILVFACLVFVSALR